MSANNGVVRIGRKGRKKFAFGEEGAPFEVDVVVAFQQWIGIDDGFRPIDEDAHGNRPIPTVEMPAYHAAAQAFARSLTTNPEEEVTVAEALDFIARLREEYDELANFFRPRSRDERASPVTSEAGLRFSVEGTEPN